MKEVEEAHERNKASLSYFTNSEGGLTHSRHTYEELCKVLNKRDAAIRADVACAIQDYLIKHGGRVDIWPDSAGQVVSTFEKLGKKVTFDYFGADYVCDPKSSVIERAEKLPVYRNSYKFPGTPAFREWKNAEWWVKGNRGQRNSQIWYLFWTALAGLCSLYVSLSLFTSLLIPSIGKYFLIWRQTFSDFANGSLWLEILALLNSILMFPARLLAVLNDELGFFWIPGLFMLGISVYAMAWCAGQIKEKGENVGTHHYDYKRHKKVLQGDGEKIALENERLRKQYEEFAEKWHRAWFEWVCSHKETSA